MINVVVKTGNRYLLELVDEEGAPFAAVEIVHVPADPEDGLDSPDTVALTVHLDREDVLVKTEVRSS